MLLNKSLRALGRKTGNHFCGVRAGHWSKKVTNWIDSGGHAARRCTLQNSRGIAGRDRVSRGKLSLRLGLAVLLSVTVANVGHARDPDGRYADSPLKQWFDSLKSGKGPCCSDADGTAISDADWESSAGHYRVRIEGEWVEVPEEAVITEPNRVGRTMVWPIRGYGGVTIRCFMPGSMA
jgi:hypothetical protein